MQPYRKRKLQEHGYEILSPSSPVWPILNSRLENPDPKKLGGQDCYGAQH